MQANDRKRRTRRRRGHVMRKNVPSLVTNSSQWISLGFLRIWNVEDRIQAAIKDGSRRLKDPHRCWLFLLGSKSCCYWTISSIWRILWNSLAGIWTILTGGFYSENWPLSCWKIILKEFLRMIVDSLQNLLQSWIVGTQRQTTRAPSTPSAAPGGSSGCFQRS